MRKLYNKFFHIPKNGKIREEVMLMRVVTTVIITVACLAAMSFSAYAYFSYSLTTGPNVIEAANFDIDIEIDGEAVDAREADLDAGKTYEITLKQTGTASTGFVVIGIGESEYHTRDLCKEPEDQAKITFTITTDEAAKVTFTAYLGTSSIYPDYQNEDDFYIDDDYNIDLSKGVSPEPEEETTTAAGSETGTAPTSAPEAESTPEPSTEAAKPEETTKPAETTKPKDAAKPEETSAPADTTAPSAPAEEPDTQPTEITTTEPADLEPNEPIEPAAENMEITDSPTTEVSE